MPGVDKATGRVVAVIVLLVVVAASLRGYLPGVEQQAQQEPPRSSASLPYVVALLAVSLAIIGASLIVRLRDPRRPAPSAGGLPDRFSRGMGRPGWRILLIGAAVLVVWLLIVWLLARFIGPHGIRAGELPGATETATPTPRPDTSPPPEPRNDRGDGDVLGYLIASTVTLALLLVVGAIAAVRGRRTAKPHVLAAEPFQPPAPTASSESLARAAEVGLAEIGDLSREPREAIIACYAAMERELAHVPEAVPQDSDTPTEVLTRAVEHHALHADNAARLVNLFEEARFSPHVMNESHRETAVRVLQLVLAELRSAV
ncbi:DUF4129 domain-containing protein [Mycobacterium branderi]|uniref:Protein-glutamine gamma-glutamyltransferase-like C-terminal domain-containing protein n=1 Tax=Mycobacterium branderi TaxID=43348 RepID=A0A7I7VYF9_9MYCO|nr:DUF4129 domain-containing protein [Mycobacterium branderi]MCV7232888.1 DUF4129 domain-containing protein [Mycobacterium branderi]ORA41010.1 hypothetical protein BST20_02380 [Mycobacterium branderi]BBZ09990.1 hypothetical protein MBRA_01850 [Mycobacterium branderi]